MYTRRDAVRQFLMGAATSAIPLSISNNASAGNSSFFFIAIKQYWRCIETDNLAGDRTITITSGIEESQSRQFRDKTGIELGAEVGAAAGGFSAKFTATYTRELEVTTNNSSTQRYELREERHFTVPEGQTTAFWQRVGGISIYNSSGDVVASAEMRYKDPRKLSA
jgi:hypothetical protein